MSPHKKQNPFDAAGKQKNLLRNGSHIERRLLAQKRTRESRRAHAEEGHGERSAHMQGDARHG